MKILFASDLSFNYFSEFIGKEAIRNTMENTAEYFREADFSVINLESVFGNKTEHNPIPKAGPNQMSPDGFIECINVLKPSAVGMANNHTLDYGADPMLKTAELLRTRGCQVFGLGKNITEAYEPAIFEKDGTCIEVYAVCENESGIADNERPGAAGYKLGLVKKAIKASRSRGALPIIFFHGGNERNPFPSPGKTEMYRNFVDMGAAAVIAMHTHCPQGYEIYEGAPIIYSMGNFYFPKPGLEHTLLPTWSVGYMCMIDITVSGTELKIIPYKFDTSSHTVLEGDDLDYFLKYLEEITKPIADEKRLRELFDSWCMIAGIGGFGQFAYMNTINIFNVTMLDEYKKNKTKEMTRMMHVLSCEAHHELMTNAFDLVYKEKTEDAVKNIDYIVGLQQYRM